MAACRTSGEFADVPLLLYADQNFSRIAMGKSNKNLKGLPERILFIDDHPLVLSGLAEMLRGCGCYVATARQLAEAVHLLATEKKFDMMLLDINLGLENGLDLLENPSPNMADRVVLLSGVMEHESVLHGFQMGAFGFIPKSVEPDVVVDALVTLMTKPRLQNSGWVWSPEFMDMVDAHSVFPKHMLLTPKEREVFMLMREGKLDKQIADEMGLSIHTVRVHLRAIRRKRGHNRRFELT